ncbi:unnamed protein product [Rotaria sp. Silwood2]|nr:unnamed protein product [Rotaria sp. Silwood2]CAF4086826.1 unnamed protein product [Rotaria sp. Silwood2]
MPKSTEEIFALDNDVMLSSTDRSQIEKLHQLWSKVQELITKFNLFSSPSPPTGDVEFEIKTQIISTRSYLLPFSVSLFVLAIYIGEVPVTTTITMHSPSYEQYSYLYQQYPRSLSCPCTTISTRYNEFIDVKVARYHQVCESVYVTPIWPFAFANLVRFQRIYIFDFRAIGSPFFKTLAAFCTATRQAIDDELFVFNAQHFVTSEVMPIEVFEKEAQSTVQSFVGSTTRLFIRSIGLLRETIQANNLFSGLTTNLRFAPYFFNNQSIYILPTYNTYMGNLSSPCYCHETPTCVSSTHIFNEYTQGPPVAQFTLPGLFVGCFLVEAVLQSNLVCFYNQSCIDELRRNLNATIPFDTPALDTNIESQYKPSSAIGDIVVKLMVEQWSNTTSHKAYYAQCKPAICTYSFVGKNSWFVVMTKIIALVSGLSTILKIVVPRAVKMVLSHFKNRVRPFATN